jgi:threonine/homoserine/homoserine lactone efflux protein
VTLNGLLIFAGIYATAVASPGPGIAAIIARSLGHGLRGISFLIAGFVAGDLTLMVLAATGLAVLVQAFGPLLLAIKLAGAAYLVFLAWKLWNAPTNAQAAGEATREDSPWRLFLGGYSLTVGNPKAIVFFMAILPTVVDLRAMDVWKLGQIAAVIICLMPLVLGTYAIAAARARKLFTSPDSIRKVNRATAAVMAGAAAVVASS